MAVFNTGVALSMKTFAPFDFAGEVASGYLTDATPTLFRMGSFVNTYNELVGMDFEYGAGNLPTGGTVTAWTHGFFVPEFRLDPLPPIPPVFSPQFTLHAIAVDAAVFANALSTNTIGALLPTILSGEDTIGGSDGADHLLGYAGNDLIGGNGGDDIVDGGSGSDVMVGGLGNDTYIVDNAGDGVTESSGEGLDTVKSFVTYTLAPNVEVLRLVGTAAINGNGNGLANTIRGNAAANVINGGGGADDMAGGAGNDTYYVDNAGDLVSEGFSAGTDTVKSFITYTLTSNVERLALLGSNAINGSGNGLANVLTGNSAANVLNAGNGNDVLRGEGGADSLIGGAGDDVLTGGAGGDLYYFKSALSASTNVDRITDFSIADDTVIVDQDIFTALTVTGTLSLDAFHTGSSAHDASDRIIYNSATGNIYYDADGLGGAAQVMFAQVTAGLALTNADFRVVA